MRARKLAMLWVLLAVVVACSRSQAPAPTPAPPPSPTDTPLPAPTATSPPPTATPLPTERPGRLTTDAFRRSACPFRMPEGQVVECGMVTVPQDHAKPDGPALLIAVALFLDEGEGHRPDPIMVLAGGPGEPVVGSTVELAQMLAPIRVGRDLVVFDQRGAGLSQPALECPEVVQARFDLLDEPDTHVALQTAYDAWMECRGRLVREGHDLSAFTTAQNAADVDAIRVALGYDEVNLYGGSYGSYLAQAVMRDHPEAIRSVVLESVWPLDVSFAVATEETVPRAILQLLQACEDDSHCAAAYPNLTNTFYEVVDRLNAEPVTVTLTDPVSGQTLQALLNGDSVLANLKMVLYQTPAMPYVPRAIYDVFRGDYSLMVRLSNLLLAHFDVLTEGMEMSMLCAEDLIGRSVQEVLETRSAWPGQLVGSVDPTDIVDYGLFALCDGWAVPEADLTAKDPLYSHIPALVLSGEFDPVTPPEFGKAVADRLTNAYYYELRGSGHVGESTSKCALQMTAAFLQDPLMEPDAACVEEMEELMFRLPGEVPAMVLEPYENEVLGLRALAPAGWAEPQPGLFTRGHPIVDMALLQLQLLERPAADIVTDLSAAPGLSQPLQVAGVRTSDRLRWTLYTFATGDTPWDMALAEVGDTTLLAAVRSAGDERHVMYEMLFLPVVDACEPLE